MARETKIGLLVIIVLASAFGFVVFKKIQKRNDLLIAETGEGDRDGAGREDDRRHKPRVKPVAPFDSRAKDKRNAKSNAGSIFKAQKEPNKREKHGGTRSRDRRVAEGGLSNSPEGAVGLFDRAGERKQDKHRRTTPARFAGNERTKDRPLFPDDDADHTPRKTFGDRSSDADGGGNPFASYARGRQPANGDSRSTAGGASPGTHDSDAKDLWDLGSREAARKTVRGAANAGITEHGAQRSEDADHSPLTTHHSPLTPSGTGGEHSRRESPSVSPHRQAVFERSKIGGQKTEFGDRRVEDQKKTLDAGRSALDPALTRPSTIDSQPHRNHRLGAYRLGSSGSATAHSTTTVPTGDDVEFPFGKPADFGQNRHRVGPHELRSRSRLSPSSSSVFPRQVGASPVRPGDKPRVYTVQRGDNYWTISRKAYHAGRYYQALAAYNRYRIADPTKIRPGMKVLVPGVEILAERFPKLCPGHVAAGTDRREKLFGFFRDESGRPMYRVGKSDTLGEIAQKHLGRASRWIQLYEMNRDRIKSPQNLKIGTELRLPADASRVRLVRKRRDVR